MISIGMLFTVLFAACYVGAVYRIADMENLSTFLWTLIGLAILALTYFVPMPEMLMGIVRFVVAGALYMAAMTVYKIVRDE